MLARENIYSVIATIGRPHAHTSPTPPHLGACVNRTGSVVAGLVPGRSFIFDSAEKYSLIGAGVRYPGAGVTDDGRGGVVDDGGIRRIERRCKIKI